MATKSSFSQIINVSTSPLQITSLVPGGQGIATAPNGQKIFLWNALPGEAILEYQVTKRKTHYLEGIATKISRPSSHRIEPRDDCFLSTSPWQILSYQFELEQKLQLLQEQFRQVGLLNLPISPVQTDGQDFFYRNKMEYSLYWDHSTNQIQLAFHQRGSHRKLPITTSSLEHPKIFQAAQEIIQNLNNQGAEARTYQSLLLRCNQSGRLAGGLFENHQPHPKFTNLSDYILGSEYFYSPNGFFQINLPVYEMALRVISEQIKSSKVVDLYAGVGTIGLSVTKSGQLISVESNPAAYQELVRNAANSPHSSLKIQPVLAKSEEVLDFIQSDCTVIVDPPRAGCDIKLLARFLSELPSSIIYLSCNPATQARDLAILQEKYIIERIIPFNFFPRTPHLETVALLSRP